MFGGLETFRSSNFMACGEIALFVLNPKTHMHVHTHTRTHVYEHKFLKYLNILNIPYSVAEGKAKIKKILPVTCSRKKMGLLN